MPLSGGPDALRDIDVPVALARDGTFTAVSGDSLILISTWPRSGAWQVESVVPFGSSKLQASRHYTDQAQLPPHMLRQVRRFFEDYKVLEQKQVLIEDLLGPEEALSIISDALELYRKLRRGELAKGGKI